MSDKPTIYEKLTTREGKALGAGAATAASLLALRGAAGSGLATKGLSKILKGVDVVKRPAQLSLPFNYTSRAKAILNKQLTSGGLLSKGNIALATLLGGASAGAMADYSRKNYADNLAAKIRTGRKLSRSERQAISEIADLRKLPRTARGSLTPEEKAKTFYWNPGAAAATSATIGSLLTPGGLLTRGAMGALSGAGAASDTKYRQFIMAKALRDRLRNNRELNTGETNLVQAVRALGARNA